MNTPMNKRLSTSLIVLLAMQGAVVAADLPAKKSEPVSPAPYSWDGVYVGFHQGYGWNNVTEQGYDLFPGYAGLANPVWYSQSYTSRGPFTGFQIGYNKQWGNFVLGGEFDVTWSGQNTSKTLYNSLGSALGAPLAAQYGIPFAAGGPFQTNIQDNWRWSLRARAGYADGRSLYYVTGGMVNGGYNVQHLYWGLPGVTPYNPASDFLNMSSPTFNSTANTGGNGQFNIERFGWTLGAGVEYAFNDQWSANVEYRHNDFGTATLTSVTFPGLTFRERSTEDTIRLGLNWHTHVPPFLLELPKEPEPPKGETKKAEAAPTPPPPDPTFIGRLYHAYADEWGLQSPPADPNAPPSRRPGWPPAPETQPPYPFTEWSFGGSQVIGATLPNAIDSPFMKALGPTAVGKFLEDWHIQIYGWIDPGFNISTAHSLPGALIAGNNPVAYSYTPNVFQLDQFVTIIERVPDEVQQDHWDWGFRLSPLYGETYRYTTAGGLWSTQLQKWNKFAGYDIPMIYGELYIPGIFDGVNIRAGRYISLPDIEAQLAPNNYMYSHSMTYAYDNYTNTGFIASLQVDKNFMLQAGLSFGTEAMPWQRDQVFLPPVAGGILYQPVPGVFNLTTAQTYYQGQRDPGVKPTLTACARYETDSAYDNLYLCANGINTGVWGYNNLQWYGITYYHKFDEKWHIAIESWHIHNNNVVNANGLLNTQIGLVSPNPFYYMVNSPSLAQCPGNPNPTCTARTWTALTYLNYEITPMDNISWRAEYFDDLNGQRTGTRTPYFNYGVGWQHWFSPTVELRPEVAFYNSLHAPAFETSAPLLGGVGTKSHIGMFSMDLLWHY
jgi:opacity protein-like surface antigen